MWQQSNTYRVLLPSGDQIVFGDDDRQPDWVGYLSEPPASKVESEGATAARATQDGGWIGNVYQQHRSTVVKILCISHDPAVRAEFIRRCGLLGQLRRQDGLITWTEGDGIDRAMSVRVADMELVHATDSPAKSVSVSFVSAEPNILSAEEFVAVARPRADADDQGVQFYQGGSGLSWPIITLWGPFTAASLVVSSAYGDPEQFIRIGQPLVLGADAAITATDRVVIDTRPGQRLIAKNGGLSLSRYIQWGRSNPFNPIAPGGHRAYLDQVAGAGETTRAEIAYRYAWEL